MKTFRSRIATGVVMGFLLMGCSSSDKKDTAEELKKYSSVTNKGADVVDPTYGEQTGFWYGAIGGEKSNGVAYVRSYADGTSVITVNLNVLVAEKGSHYQAFLMANDSAEKEINLGEVSSIIGDVRHSVNFVTTADIEGMRTIEVRHLRDVRGDSEVIATGTVKTPEPAVVL